MTDTDTETVETNDVQNTQPSLTRRGAIQAGAAGVAGATLFGSDTVQQHLIQHTGTAEAAAPLVAGAALVAAGGIGTGVGIGLGKLAYSAPSDPEWSEYTAEQFQQAHENIYIWGQGVQTNVIDSASEGLDGDIVQLTRGVPRAEAKLAATEAVAEGGNQQDAIDAVSQVINDFYSRLIETVIRTQETVAAQLAAYSKSLKSIGEQPVESATFDYYSLYDLATVTAPNVEGAEYTTTKSKEISLPNGDKIEYQDWEFFGEDEYDNQSYVVPPGYETGPYSHTITIDDPYDSSSNAVTVRDPAVMKTLLDEIEAARQGAISDINTIIESVYSQLSPSEASDFMESREFTSPSERYFANVNGYAESPDDSYVSDSLAEFGLKQPDDLQAEYEITYEEKTGTDSNGNATYASSETIFASGIYAYPSVSFPNNQILSGETYTTADLGGLVKVVEIKGDGSGVDRTLEGRFTVENMTDSEGENVTSIAVQDNELSSSDTTDLIKQLEEFKQNREERDEVRPSDGGLGVSIGDDIIPGVPDWTVGIPIVGTIVGYIAYKASE